MKAWTLVGLAALLLAGCASRQTREAEKLFSLEEEARVRIEKESLELEEKTMAYGSLLSDRDMLLRYEELKKSDPAAAKEMASQLPAKMPAEAEIRQANDARQAAWDKLDRSIKDVVAGYNDHLKRHPDSHDARDALGHFMADMGGRYEAAEVWRELIRRAPQRASTPNNLGTLYTHMGRDMEAVDLFRKSIELDPTEPEYWFNLGTVYATHRKEVAGKFGWSLPKVFRESLAAFGKARELRPDNFEYARSYAQSFITAKYFEVANTSEEALAAWRHCLNMKLTPQERAWTLTNMAHIHLFERKDRPAARALLADALKLDPDSIRAQDLLNKATKDQEPAAADE